MVKIFSADTARQECVDAFDQMSDEEQTFLRGLAVKLCQLYDQVGIAYRAEILDTEEEMALWSLLPSYVRSAIKKARE